MILLEIRHQFLFINLLIIALTIINIIYINNSLKNKMTEYSTMLASKITKYIVSNVYETYQFDTDRLYEIVKNDSGEIKTIIYDTMEVNSLLSLITSNVFKMFNLLENGDLEKISIRENILTNDNRYNGLRGIVLEVPSGLITENFLLASFGPNIPVKIALTGGFESHVSTKVDEYGLNNALISVYIDIKVTEQITLPFITKEIVVENKIPIAMNVINGQIPNYYVNGLERYSNIYQNN